MSSASQQPLPPDTLAKLDSRRWVVRRDAFEELVATYDAKTNPSVERALITLMEKEDITSQRGEGAERDLFEDEDYVAYSSQLLLLVEQIAAATHSSRAWRSLACARYNPDSQLGRWLASHPEALPEIVPLLKSRYEWEREVGCYVIANMLAKSSQSSNPFPTALYEHYKQRIRRVIWSDRNGPVVGFGIEGLGLTKDAEDIPFLKAFLAQSKSEFAKGEAKRIVDDLNRSGASPETSGRP